MQQIVKSEKNKNNNDDTNSISALFFWCLASVAERKSTTGQVPLKSKPLHHPAVI